LGVIFLLILLTPGFHRPGLAHAFMIEVLSPSSLLSY
jgi:hypothetical protein